MSIKEFLDTVVPRWLWVVLSVFTVVLVFLLLLEHTRAQEPDPVVRKIQHAVLYRGKDCIVTRVTVFEPRKAVMEFYVTEGGVNFNRPIPPKCRIVFP